MKNRRLDSKPTPAAPFSLSEKSNLLQSRSKVQKQQEPPVPQKFFDISYIFADPFGSQKQKQNTAAPVLSRPTSYNSKNTNLSQNLSIDSHRLTEPIHKKSNLSRFDLSFSKQEYRSTIHTRRSNTSHLRTSTARDNKTAEIEGLSNDLLVSKSFTGTVNRGQGNQTARETKRKQKRSCQRVQLITRGEAGEREAKGKTFRRMQRKQYDKYCEIGMQWAKNELVMRNKKTIRIYRPWSPLQFDQEQDFQNQNVCF